MPALRGARSGLRAGLLDEEHASPHPGSEEPESALHAEASPQLEAARPAIHESETLASERSSTLRITTPVDDSLRLTMGDDDAPDADDETEIRMFGGVECCSGFAFSFALMTLCVIDLLHVALTMLFCTSVQGRRAELLPENQWLSAASTACICIYGVKIASQVGILIQRWQQIRSLEKARSERWNATRCWREDQEWFISMTFNSFLMVFVMLLIEQPYQMQKLATLRFKMKVAAKDNRQPRKLPREDAETVAEKQSIPVNALVTVKPAVRRGQKPLRHLDAAEHSWLQVRYWQAAGDNKKKKNDCWIREDWVGEHFKRRNLGILGVFARIGRGGKKDLFASWVMLTNIACTSLAMIITAQFLFLSDKERKEGVVMAWVSLGTVVFHFMIAAGLYIFTKLIRTQGGSITRAAGAVLIGVVDIVNIIVALLLVAHLAYLNCDARYDSSAQSHDVGPLQCTDQSSEREGCAKEMCHSMCWTNSSLTAIPSDADEAAICESQFCNCKESFHREQAARIPKPHCNASSEDCRGDLRWTHSFSCATDWSAEPGSASGEKHPADQLAWNFWVFAWVMALLVGIAIQWGLALLQGLRLATLGRTRAKTESANFSLGGKHRAFDEATDLFQASTFNTWIMALALIFLERPYSRNLFVADGKAEIAHGEPLVSPFGQLYSVGKQSAGKRKAFQAAWSLVTCCKFYSVLLLFYVSMAYYRFVEPWAQQGRRGAPPGWAPLQNVKGWATLTHPLSGCRMGRILTNSSASSHDPWDISDGRSNEVTLVSASVAVFIVQMAISFWCVFVRNQKTRTGKLAALGMLCFCIVDACAICCTGYFCHCIRVRSDPLLQCEEDFGSYLLTTLHPIPEADAEGTDEGTRVYVWMATAVLCLYAVRFVLQLFALARRRTVAMQDTSNEKRLRDDDLAPAAGLLANGAVHGVFILLAMFPLDLAPLVAGRWSPMARRPHWSNGAVQLVVLLEKTILGYLMIQAVDVDHDDQRLDGEQIVRLPLVTLFVLQCTIQVGFFLVYHIGRPGRSPLPEVGDRVHVVRPEDAMRVGCCRTIFTCGRAKQGGASVSAWEEAVDSLDVALALKDVTESQRTTFALDCRATIDQPVEIDDSNWKGQVVSVTADGTCAVIRDGDASGTLIACELSGTGRGSVPIQRVGSLKWSAVAVVLAFLDWFHIAFNLMNLHIIRTTVPRDSNGLVDGFCFFQGEEMLTQQPGKYLFEGSVQYHNQSELCAAIDANKVREGSWQECNPEIGICCWICISIYVLRMVVQPSIVFWGARAFDPTKVGSTVKEAEKRLKDAEKHMRNTLSTYGENDVRYEDAQIQVHLATAAYDKAVAEALLADDTADSSEVAAVVSYDEQLRAIFDTVDDPERLEQIDDLLRDWKGSEQDLIDNIRRNYGLTDPEPEPSPSSSAVTEQLDLDATCLWEQQEKWMTTMTFNTFLMLPAMMFVRNPYKDNGESVRTSYVLLGKQGHKDYYAGMVLLLMVVKKTLNVYLIVRALTEAKITEDSNTQYISMCLLAAHFVVAMYILLLPKLANSQNGSYQKGAVLLTIALMDWFAIPIGLISLVKHGLQATGECQTNLLVKQMSWLGVVMFVVRIITQILVYLRFRFGANGWGALSRPTFATVEDEAAWKATTENDWKRWRDEFQQLTFNSW